MLQEQLFFLLPGILKRISPLPIQSCNTNPVAIRDVIDFTRKVIDPRNCQQVHRHIFTLTGDDWSRERDRLFRFLKRNDIDDSSQQCTDLLLYHDSETKQFYEDALNALIRRGRRAVDPPLWPSDTEMRLIKGEGGEQRKKENNERKKESKADHSFVALKTEYLWYAGWKGDPAAATSPDLEYLLNRKPQSAQSVIDVIIDVLLK